MAPSSTPIDWETLKPKILRLLSEGMKREDVIKEISKDGPSITKAQLEYRLKGWGRRTNLSERAWKHINRKAQKRARNNKDSAVFFNGALIPRAKVDKNTRRHDRPTLLPSPASGGSPKTPEGFDLLICTPPSSANLLRNPYSEGQHYLLDSTRMFSSLPWMGFFQELRKHFRLTSLDPNIGVSRLINVKYPTLAQLRVTLTDPSKIQTLALGFEHLNERNIALSQWPTSDQTRDRDPISRGGITWDPQIVTYIGRVIFQISNKLSTGNSTDDRRLLANLAHELKIVAESTSSWKCLLAGGRGPTSKSLIEQLFEFSITNNDITLAKMMIEIGADPNRKLNQYFPALDLVVGSGCEGLIDLLLNSGAVYGQRTLLHTMYAGDFNTADRLLRSDSSLDLNFNYVNEPVLGIPKLGFLKVETVDLVGLMSSLCADTHYTSHGIKKLRYILERRAAITLDTMILASFRADATTLQLLMQHGGETRGTNRFGFSCLAAATLREDLQSDVFDVLLHSDATIDIPQTNQEVGPQASPIHWLCSRQRLNHEFDQVIRILDVLIKSGVNINYHILHQSSPSQLHEERDKFLWSQPSQYTTPVDCITQAKAESHLEYAIIAGNESIALELVRRGCQVTSRETKLAVKFGLLALLEVLLSHSPWAFDTECIRRTCLRLALRWSHDMIVQFLIGEGVTFGEQDMIDALQYPGMSTLSTATQIGLIRATPGMEKRQIFGLPLLELCFLKFTGTAVREILRLYPAAYDSGALSATVVRALKADEFDKDGFHVADIQAIIRRRTEHNRDWEKENTALLLATMFRRPGVVRALITPGTACVLKAARLPKEDFIWLMDPRRPCNPYIDLDPTHILGCRDWVACSPMMGLATTRYSDSVSQDILDHLLACSYEPDALTVVVAATRGNLYLLRRFQCLANWRKIMSIDDHDRPPWCSTALQVAVSDGNEELVQFFLNEGVSVNEGPANQPMGAYMPRTALQAAIDKGNLELMNLFIQRGACINASAGEDSGATALQLACIHGHLEMSLRLLELGADVNTSGALRHGRTALQGAAEHGRIDTIQLLLSHGACMDRPYRVQYVKAVLYAEKNRHFAAAALLKEHREWTAEDEECYRSIQLDGLCDE